VADILDELRPAQRSADVVRGERYRLLLAIFAGGVVGTLARAGLARALPPSGAGWPWATFAVNAAGAFLLGALFTRLQERLPPSAFRRPFAGTGVCGALTTFSTLQIEVIRLGREGHAALALAYLVASLATGFGLLYLATAAVRRVRP
jgi:CrcB protein